MLEHLNEAQRQAATAPDGPVLVLAGAGTGKTRVLVERLAWLIHERGIPDRQLLSLTFTNRAAREMLERVQERLETSRLATWLGTFHSFGAYLLRREAEHAGLRPSFTIFDTNDQTSLMKRLIKDLSPRWTQVSPKDALAWISRQKQNLKDIDGEPHSAIEEAYGELYKQYHAALRHANAVDFDDLLVLTVHLLKSNEAVRDKYRRRYSHIHVDEYQDTNHAQYQILRQLTGKDGNLFVVGDEDQSIYGWRGAKIGNILNFERDFPNARTYRLEQNYRSTTAILAAANALVLHNEHRLGKQLWTKGDSGEPVRFYLASDGKVEAGFVVERIDTMLKDGVAARDVAVLFRTNAQSRILEEAFQQRGLAYVVVGGVRFYSRKEVKDLLAYLRLLVNPDDDVSFLRVVNVPTRGLGTASAERLRQYAAERGQSYMTVARELEHDETISTRARNALASFLHLIDEMTLLTDRLPAAQLVETVLDKSGYRNYVRKMDEKEARNRFEIIEEFISGCANFDSERNGRPGGLAEYLQSLSLLTDVDDFDENTPAVTLMTCHSAKGLEFDHVFLVGLEEGLLPHVTALEDERELEEERRLCYVAMTRARKTLNLTAAQERVVYGTVRACETSRFLAEIPPEYVRVIAQTSPATSAPAARRDTRNYKARRTVPAGTAPPAIGHDDELKMGMRVRHATFGPGTVMYTRGSGNKMRVRVRFNTGRTREFMAAMAPLEVIGRDRR